MAVHNAERPPGNPQGPLTAPPSVLAPCDSGLRQHVLDQIVEIDNYTRAIVALDDIVTWANAVLGPIAQLSQYRTWAENQALATVAPHILAAITQLEEYIDLRAPYVLDVKAACLDSLGEGEVA